VSFKQIGTSFYNLSFLKDCDYDFGLSNDCSTYSVQKLADSSMRIMAYNLVHPLIISKVGGITLTQLEKKIYNEKFIINDIDKIYDQQISNCNFFTAI